MKTFNQYLMESEPPSEFIVTILVKGTTDESFIKCSEQCRWINKTDKSVKCDLFKETLKTKKEEESEYLLRTKNCLSVTDSLI
jgi:hypothetical protein